MVRAFLVSVLALGLAASQSDEDNGSRSSHDIPARQETFWSSLQELYGLAFEGTDPGVHRVMHMRQRSPDEIRIPLQVDDDRSRYEETHATPPQAIASSTRPG